MKKPNAYRLSRIHVVGLRVVFGVLGLILFWIGFVIVTAIGLHLGLPKWMMVIASIALLIGCCFAAKYCAEYSIAVVKRNLAIGNAIVNKHRHYRES